MPTRLCRLRARCVLLKRCKMTQASNNLHAPSSPLCLQALLNGVDVTALIPANQLTISPGSAALWSIPATVFPGAQPIAPGTVWTLAVHWADPSTSTTAAGGMFWPELFPVETWPGGKDCPFPGANTSNYDVHRSHGISCFFLDHDPNTVSALFCEACVLQRSC